MLSKESPYSGSCIIMTTQHAKSVAVAPAFREELGATVLEYVLDTDKLGTFSREIERASSALDAARKKCELGIELLDTDYAIASEGSFGPDPYLPLIPCGQEILYFIDRRRNFHLHVSRLCDNTNYQMQAVDSLEKLHSFAGQVQFPSHALIIRPNQWRPGGLIFKGVMTPQNLNDAFLKSRLRSPDRLVWVETDMRAHMNPTRMTEIGELARTLAHRLSTLCPLCETPGWGTIRAEKGLRCEYCDQPTDMIAYEVLGCVRCDHTVRSPRSDGLKIAPQMHCGWCNP